MLSFSTNTKKKRNWREMTDDAEEVDANNGDVEDDEEIDEKAIEAAMAEQEKEVCPHPAPISFI
eukprot:SAG11_NODE_28019_length_326_cov_0.841410_2_plen_64_part_00